MNYSVKNVKSWMARDGIGTTCTLYRDGKKVAMCRDDGNGGEMDIDWLDYKEPRVDINVTISDYDAEKDENGERPEKAHTYKGTPEQKLMAEWANAQVTVYHGTKLRRDAGWVVSELCDAYEMAKKLKNKTGFVVLENGQEVQYTMNTPYTAKVEADLKAEYGDKLVKILNTEYVSDEQVEKQRLAKLKRKCKGKTLIRIKGDDEGTYRIVNSPYTHELAKMLRVKYEVVEIINETLMAA